MNHKKQKRTSREHYVPQCYLRYFADSKEALFAFDKEKRCWFSAKVRDLAVERDFNEFKETLAPLDPKFEQYFERRFSQIESELSKHIKNIQMLSALANPDAEVVTGHMRANLAQFVALQFLRTKEFREFSRQVLDQLGKTALKHASDSKSTDFRLSEDSLKSQHLRSLARVITDCTNTLFNMPVCLAVNDTRLPYWTSDNPVVKLIQQLANEPFEFTTIAMPLTPSIQVQFLSPTLHPKNLSLNSRLRFVSEEEVVKFNELQLATSYRMLFSSTSNFESIQSLLEKNPAWANSKRQRFTMTKKVQADLLAELRHVRLDDEAVQKFREHYSN